MTLICDSDYFGSVVQSTAGRDRLRMFLVLGVTGGVSDTRLAVADGRLHSAALPKLKNPKHVRVAAHLSDAELAILAESPDDAVIRELLRPYDGRFAEVELSETEICE